MTAEYTREQLIEMCATNQDQVVRRLAAEMLYTLGQRDQLAEDTRNFEKVANDESLHGQRHAV